MVDKVLLKYVMKDGYDFVFEEIENNSNEVILKIYKEKDFYSKIEVGEIGYGLFNGNWLNEWQNVQDSERDTKLIKKVSPAPPSKKDIEETNAELEGIWKLIEKLESQLSPLEMGPLGMVRGNANTCAATILAGSTFDRDKWDKVRNGLYVSSLQIIVGGRR